MERLYMDVLEPADELREKITKTNRAPNPNTDYDRKESWKNRIKKIYVLRNFLKISNFEDLKFFKIWKFLRFEFFKIWNFWAKWLKIWNFWRVEIFEELKFLKF